MSHCSQLYFQPEIFCFLSQCFLLHIISQKTLPRCETTHKLVKIKNNFENIRNENIDKVVVRLHLLRVKRVTNCPVEVSLS